MHVHVSLIYNWYVILWWYFQFEQHVFILYIYCMASMATYMYHYNCLEVTEKPWNVMLPNAKGRGRYNQGFPFTEGQILWYCHQRKQDYSMYQYMHWEVKIKPLWNAYKPLLGREECGIHWQKWSQFVRGGVPEPYWCSPSLVNGMFYGMVNLLLF